MKKKRTPKHPLTQVGQRIVDILKRNRQGQGIGPRTMADLARKRGTDAGTLRKYLDGRRPLTDAAPPGGTFHAFMHAGGLGAQFRALCGSVGLDRVDGQQRGEPPPAQRCAACVVKVPELKKGWRFYWRIGPATRGEVKAIGRPGGTGSITLSAIADDLGVPVDELLRDVAAA